MMQLPCPYCGLRDETEFVCGGESHVTRPPLAASDDEWADYLFGRRNPKGMTNERWHHRFGCSQWFNIERDTLAHAIGTAYLMIDAKPGTK